MKKILVFLGHTDKTSYSASLADVYELGARGAGYTVERINIGDLSFDPILHRGYKEIQELEPDLITVQEKIKWADHIVFIYPNWWVTMPAVFKGMFDRMWLPGFAFNFDMDTRAVTKHLTGKTARIIIVSGTYSPLMTWWKFGDYTNELAYGILGFAGIKAKVTALGPSDHVPPDTLVRWSKRINTLGTQGK